MGETGYGRRIQSLDENMEGRGGCRRTGNGNALFPRPGEGREGGVGSRAYLGTLALFHEKIRVGWARVYHRLTAMISEMLVASVTYILTCWWYPHTWESSRRS